MIKNQWISRSKPRNELEIRNEAGILREIIAKS